MISRNYRSHQPEIQRRNVQRRLGRMLIMIDSFVMSRYPNDHNRRRLRRRDLRRI